MKSFVILLYTVIIIIHTIQLHLYLMFSLFLQCFGSNIFENPIRYISASQSCFIMFNNDKFFESFFHLSQSLPTHNEQCHTPVPCLVTTVINYCLLLLLVFEKNYSIELGLLIIIIIIIINIIDKYCFFKKLKENKQNEEEEKMTERI